MESDIEYIKQAVNEVKDSLHEHIKWEEQKYESLDTKYASKKIETFFWWGFGAAGTVVVGAIVTFIIKGGLS